MKRFLLLSALLLAAGAGCLPWGAPRGPGLARCDYEGTAFMQGRQRPAGDGCNVCTCGQLGWTCTTERCTDAPGYGTISGALSYPSESIPPQRVCALNLQNERETCVQTVANTETYGFNVPPGDYWVYATLADRPSDFPAYYSEFVRCGVDAGCKDHSPITLTVNAGETAAADPQDWYVTMSIGQFHVAPSKREYDAYNYYPNAAFGMMTRGAASVELFATPWPPDESAAPQSLGQAELEGYEGKFGIWMLPVPPGFEAARVYAVATSNNGDIVRSRGLHVVRPVSVEKTTAPE